jgi:hypothetical protein
MQWRSAGKQPRKGQKITLRVQTEQTEQDEENRSSACMLYISIGDCNVWYIRLIWVTRLLYSASLETS